MCVDKATEIIWRDELNIVQFSNIEIYTQT